MAETESNDETLELRILQGVDGKLKEIATEVGVLTSNKNYPTLLGTENYGTLVSYLGIISEGLERSIGVVDALRELYTQREQEAISEDRLNLDPSKTSFERRFIHDMRNYLTAAIGYPELILLNSAYRELLGTENYQDFSDRLNSIKTAASGILEPLDKLGGIYNNRDPDIVRPNDSDLAPEITIYTIVHIDDQPVERLMVSHALESSSNIEPPTPGQFGHERKRFEYRLHSFASVDEALEHLPDLLSAGKVDLVLTDRQMPEKDGRYLLAFLSDPKDPKSRKPEYAGIERLAMLTAGIQPKKAEDLEDEYGIRVLTKPVEPLKFEQHMYNIMTHQN